MMKEIVFRRAKPVDLSHIQVLARHTIDHSYRPFLRETAVDRFINSGESDKTIATQIESCYVLVDNGKIKACCIYAGNFIEIMMVAFNAHRRGYGSQLLKFVEGQLFNKGHTTLRLETFQQNQQAINFYLKNGWEIVEDTADGDEVGTRVLFEKWDIEM